MTDPNRNAGKNSEQLLEEALRARAGGTPGIGRPRGGSTPARPVAQRQSLTVVQLILASLIAGLVVGILAAVLTLI